MNHPLLTLFAFFLVIFSSPTQSRVPKWKAPPAPEFEASSPRTKLVNQTKWQSISYESEPFVTPKLQIIQNVVNQTSPGSLFLTPYGFGSVTNSTMILSPGGTLVWQSEVLNFYSHLRTQEFKNETYLTFWNSSFHGPDRGNGYGSVDFLDSSYSLIYRICLAELALTTANNATYPCYVDLHESQMTDRGSVLVTAYNVSHANLSAVGGSEQGWVLDSQFYEVDVATEKILFSWKHSDHLSEMPYGKSHYPLHFQGFPLGRAQAAPWDPFHINSIQKLDDGYLISARHFWTIYKIWENGTIAWTLDGDKKRIITNDTTSFTFTPDVQFRWQHYARLSSTCNYTSEATLTFFNNDNSEVDNSTLASTGMSFSLNTGPRTATLFRALDEPAREVSSDAEGSHQVLSNGNALLGYGQIPMIKEFAPAAAATVNETSTIGAASAVVYSAQFGPLIGTTSYRTFKLDNWHAIPAYPPKAVAKRIFRGLDTPHSFTRTRVYMSWNGATEYDGWDVVHKTFEGPQEQLVLASVNKHGFETSVEIAGVFGKGELVVQAKYKGLPVTGGEAVVAMIDRL